MKRNGAIAVPLSGHSEGRRRLHASFATQTGAPTRLCKPIDQIVRTNPQNLTETSHLHGFRNTEQKNERVPEF